jgi:hypothetical protein
MFVIKNNKFNLLTTVSPKHKSSSASTSFLIYFLLYLLAVYVKIFNFFDVLPITKSTKSHILPSLAKNRKIAIFFRFQFQKLLTFSFFLPSQYL